MQYKFSIQGILYSKAITFDDLANLLFADIKFPKSALRRLVKMPNTTTLSQAITIADNLGISLNKLICHSYIFELINSTHVQEARHKCKMAFIPSEHTDYIVLIKNIDDCTLQNIQYKTIRCDNGTENSHDATKQYLLNLII